MRIFFTIVCLFVCGNGFAQTAGTLDTTFGIGGRVLTDFYNSSNDAIYSMVIQSDGKIIAAGFANDTNYTVSAGLARYNTNGTLDNSFGNFGKVNTGMGSSFSGGGIITSVALQPDGKILVGGSANNTENDGDFALARFNTNGTLDNSFGTSGIVVTDLDGGSFDRANGMILQDDGKIILVGATGPNLPFIPPSDFALARYHTNGTLDNSFGSGGIVTTHFDTSTADIAYSVALHADGKIVVAGGSRFTENWKIATARYEINGTLDNSFDADGMLNIELMVGKDVANAVKIQSDGKILLAGTTPSSADYYSDFILARLNIDGSPDVSFGGDGIVTTNFDVFSEDKAYSLALESSDKIVVAGWASEAFGIARYNTNGTLDNTFGTNGLVKTTFYPNSFSANELARSILIQPDGKIVAGGLSKLTTAASYDFAVARYHPGCICVAPTSLVISNTTTNSSTVSWTGNDCAVKYRIHFQNLYTGAAYIYYVNAPITTYNFTGLQSATDYLVKIRTLCNNTGSIASGFSQIVYFTTNGTAACTSPTNISSTILSNTSVKVTWTPVAGSVGYQLRYRKVGAIAWTYVAVLYGATNNKTLTGLVPNTSYQVQLSTKCTMTPATYSAYSTSYTFTTPLREEEEETIESTTETNTILLYPNPSNGTVHFNLNGEAGIFVIYDLGGKLLRQINVALQSPETIVTDLPNGVLLYRFINENGLVSTGKFVVIRN